MARKTKARKTGGKIKGRRTKGSVGIVGLGTMGGAFARNLVADRWHVVGYDIDPAVRRRMAKAGVEIADDVATLAQQVPTIITSLPKPEALFETIIAIERAKVTRRVIVEASTFALDDKLAAERALRNAGHIALDCPVSGTGAQAAIGDLVVYASGNSAAIRKLRPLFAGFSRQVHDLGAYGNGSRMKYVANLLVAIHNVASAEAMVLGMKSGLAPEQIFKLISVGAGNSRIFELRAPMMVKNRYDPATMKNYLWQKDMVVIEDFAKKLGVPTPLFSATFPIYAGTLTMGHAEHDTAAVCAVLEKMAGVTRKQKN